MFAESFLYFNNCLKCFFFIELQPLYCIILVELFSTWSLYEKLWTMAHKFLI